MDLFLEAPPRIELGMKVLQTSALPLGYGALSGAGNGARTRHLSLGKAALYQMSYSRRRMGYYNKILPVVNGFEKIFFRTQGPRTLLQAGPAKTGAGNGTRTRDLSLEG